MKIKKKFKKLSKKLARLLLMILYLHSLKQNKQADVAQLVEHDLAKVGVTSSSLVIRSKVWNSSHLFLFL